MVIDMTNPELKQYAEEQFDLNVGDSAERVKWAQVLATCLQTEVMKEGLSIIGWTFVVFVTALWSAVVMAAILSKI